METGIHDKKITQQELADSIGTTRQAIAQYLDGSVYPNAEKVSRIADFFDISADYLLGRNNEKSAKSMQQFSDEIDVLAKNLQSLYGRDSIINKLSQAAHLIGEIEKCGYSGESLDGYIQIMLMSCEYTFAAYLNIIKTPESAKDNYIRMLKDTQATTNYMRDFKDGLVKSAGALEELENS